MKIDIWHVIYFPCHVINQSVWTTRMLSNTRGCYPCFKYHCHSYTSKHAVQYLEIKTFFVLLPLCSSPGLTSSSLQTLSTSGSSSLTLSCGHDLSTLFCFQRFLKTINILVWTTYHFSFYSGTTSYIHFGFYRPINIYNSINPYLFYTGTLKTNSNLLEYEDLHCWIFCHFWVHHRSCLSFSSGQSSSPRSHRLVS